MPERLIINYTRAGSDEPIQILVRKQLEPGDTGDIAEPAMRKANGAKPPDIGVAALPVDPFASFNRDWTRFTDLWELQGAHTKNDAALTEFLDQITGYGQSKAGLWCWLEKWNALLKLLGVEGKGGTSGFEVDWPKPVAPAAPAGSAEDPDA